MWFESIAVGIPQHCTFIADIIGTETIMEHLPKPEKSFITAILFCFISLSSLRFLPALPQMRPNNPVFKKSSVAVAVVHKLPQFFPF